MSAEGESSAETAATERVEKNHQQKVGIGRHPGGQRPAVGDLFQETMTEFTENIGPYALAGLGQLAVILPLTFLLIIGVYVAMFAGFGVMFVGMAGLIAVLPEELLGLGILASQLGGLGVMIVAIFAGALLFGIALSPINASLVRAVAEHQRGGTPLSFGAAFSTALHDIPRVMLTTAIVATAVTVGLMFCYLPALIPALFLGWATTMVALHRAGPIQATRTSVGHVLAEMPWHLPFFGLYLVIAFIGGNIPVLGAMFAMAFHVRAYRHLFGDGDEVAS